jgi:hypothetical protein
VQVPFMLNLSNLVMLNLSNLVMLHLSNLSCCTCRTCHAEPVEPVMLHLSNLSC